MMIVIDGSMGEGGGQIVRSALSLSLLTGKPFSVDHIRAARPNPGLRPQHLAAVRAAVCISGARVEGDYPGSQQLFFDPGQIKPGTYRFDIGTAGATTLLLQTVLMPLAMAEGPSHLTISGGTHVPWSPSYHYLDWHWRPFLNRMDINIDLILYRAGFYPHGGGEIGVSIPGGAKPRGMVLVDRGKLLRIKGLSAVSNLSPEIAERQRRQAINRLRSLVPQIESEIDTEILPGTSPGTLFLLLAEFESSQACFAALGERGKLAERVADEAVNALASFILSDGAIDPWLADQLLLPLAMAKEPSIIRTSAVTQHLLTNAKVISCFLAVAIELEKETGRPSMISIQPQSRMDSGYLPL